MATEGKDVKMAIKFKYIMNKYNFLRERKTFMEKRIFHDYTFV